jgi:hypothetical protein
VCPSCAAASRAVAPAEESPPAASQPAAPVSTSPVAGDVRDREDRMSTVTEPLRRDVMTRPSTLSALAVAAGLAVGLGGTAVDAALSLKPGAARPTAPAAVGAPVDAQLRLSQIRCVSLSRDELYICVRGDTVGERSPLHVDGEQPASPHR